MEHKTPVYRSRRFLSALAFLLATGILEFATPDHNVDVTVLAGLFAAVFGLVIYGYNREDAEVARNTARQIVTYTPGKWDDQLLDLLDALDEAIQEGDDASPAG